MIQSAILACHILIVTLDKLLWRFSQSILTDLGLGEPLFRDLHWHTLDSILRHFAALVFFLGDQTQRLARGASEHFPFGLEGDVLRAEIFCLLLILLVVNHSLSVGPCYLSLSIFLIVGMDVLDVPVEVVGEIAEDFLRQFVVLAPHVEVKDVRSILVLNDATLAEGEVVVSWTSAEDHPEAVSQRPPAHSSTRFCLIILVVLQVSELCRAQR